MTMRTDRPTAYSSERWMTYSRSGHILYVNTQVPFLFKANLLQASINYKFFLSLDLFLIERMDSLQHTTPWLIITSCFHLSTGIRFGLNGETHGTDTGHQYHDADAIQTTGVLQGTTAHLPM